MALNLRSPHWVALVSSGEVSNSSGVDDWMVDLDGFIYSPDDFEVQAQTSRAAWLAGQDAVNYLVHDVTEEAYQGPFRLNIFGVTGETDADLTIANNITPFKAFNTITGDPEQAIIRIIAANRANDRIYFIPTTFGANTQWYFTNVPNAVYPADYTAIDGPVLYRDGPDTWLDVGVSPRGFSNMHHAEVNDDGVLFLAHTDPNFSSHGGMGVWKPTTGVWQSADGGVSGDPAGDGQSYINHLCLHSNNHDIIAVGNFNSAGGVSCNGIAVYRVDSDSWEAFGGAFALLTDDDRDEGLLRARMAVTDDWYYIAGGFGPHGGSPIYGTSGGEFRCPLVFRTPANNPGDWEVIGFTRESGGPGPNVSYIGGGKTLKPNNSLENFRSPLYYEPSPFHEPLFISLTAGASWHISDADNTYEAGPNNQFRWGTEGADEPHFRHKQRDDEGLRRGGRISSQQASIRKGPAAYR